MGCIWQLLINNEVMYNFPLGGTCCSHSPVEFSRRTYLLYNVWFITAASAVIILILLLLFGAVNSRLPPSLLRVTFVARPRC